MNIIIEIILILSVAALIHTYLLFPLIIKIISSFYKNDIIHTDNIFSISILISAYNEEKVIRERINNISKLNYDFNKVEVLIGSDCSTDRTNEILAELEKRYSWLSIYLFDEREGKASVINRLVQKAKNEILILTDANVEFEKDSMKIISLNFNNREVGGVSGRIILREPGKDFILEKKYWDYDTKIKIYEGRCGILIGANGGMYAVRRNLFKYIPEDKAVTDDLFSTLSILNQNYRFTYEFNAISYEEVSHHIKNEYKRKTRFAATNYQTILYFKNLLFNKNILLSFSLWSHKIFRWFSPFFLVILLITNFLLFSYNDFFKLLFCFQFIFYFLVLCGFLFRNIKIKIIIFTIPFYFAMTNYAQFAGLLRFIFKKHTSFWESTPRI